ncbi:MAG: hypothetical protein VXV96_08335 [Bdellovibrionota bacterium]|nr:hypothetical protein [Bdellovibrionota bacterium]
MIQMIVIIITFFIAVYALWVATSEDPEIKKELKTMEDEISQLEKDLEQMKADAREVKRLLLLLMPTVEVLCNINNVPTKDELRDVEEDIIKDY